MTRRTFLLPLALAGALVALAALAVTSLTIAQEANLHGIGFAKGCNGPVNPGDEYTCGFLIANTEQLDTAGDTLEVTSLTDVVHGAGGDVASGELLASRVVAINGYAGGAQCYSNAAQTVPVPEGGTGSVVCVLPTNSAVAFARAPVGYVITEADALAGQVDDDATIVYLDTCSSGADDCPVGPNENQAASSAEVNPPTPTPTATPTATNTPTPTPTATATNTPVPPTNTPTPTPTSTPVPPTNTPTPTATATPTPPVFEGCTPGFWKQDQHFDSWQTYSPDQLVSSVFTIPAASGIPADTTLLQALEFNGGSGVDGASRILLRAAVAALLNAASDDVDFNLTTAQVISAVNTALASGDRDTILAEASRLDGFNNQGVCGLS
jgi:hypothetical protein